MNTLKRILLTSVVLAAGYLPAPAQPLTCTDPGTVLEYTEYDAKGKLEGYTEKRIETCTADENGWLTVTVRSSSFDARHNPVKIGAEGADSPELPELPAERILVRPTEMELFPSDLLSGGFAGTGGKIDISASGDPYILPSEPSPGEALPDTKTVITLRNGDKEMTLEWRITERQVLASGMMTTPAGTFATYEISEKIALVFSIRIFNTSMQHITWYAPGIGVVREEERNKKGKLMSVSELTAIRRPAAGK